MLYLHGSCTVTWFPRKKKERKKGIYTRSSRDWTWGGIPILPGIFSNPPPPPSFSSSIIKKGASGAGQEPRCMGGGETGGRVGNNRSSLFPFNFSPYLSVYMTEGKTIFNRLSCFSDLCSYFFFCFQPQPSDKPEMGEVEGEVNNV